MKGGQRSLLCPVSAAISEAHQVQAVQECARISTLEHGGLGE